MKFDEAVQKMNESALSKYFNNVNVRIGPFSKPSSIDINKGQNYIALVYEQPGKIDISIWIDYKDDFEAVRILTDIGQANLARKEFPLKK